jgi:hypothetical protein
MQAQKHCRQTMFSTARLLQIVGVLAIIALAATDISLALQNHFGRSLVLMLRPDRGRRRCHRFGPMAQETGVSG